MQTARVTDVVCRLGGEEFGVIMSDTGLDDARAFAVRIDERLAEASFDPAGNLSVSTGIAQAPGACDESTRARRVRRGGHDDREDQGQAPDRGVRAGGRPAPGGSRERQARRPLDRPPEDAPEPRGKLSRLNDVSGIGETIVTELRTLIDYHNGRLYLAEGDRLVPIAFRGELGDYRDETADVLECRMGEGITGRVALTGRSVLIPNALDCDYAVQVPGTPRIAESIVAVPLRYATGVLGVIVISKLGENQFDEDDVRLLEVLAGHASVALENARLYDAERHEAERARESADIASSLLELGRELALAETVDEALKRIVGSAARILGSPKTSIWLQDTPGDDLVIGAEFGHSQEERTSLEELPAPRRSFRSIVRPERPVVVDGAVLSRVGELGMRAGRTPGAGRPPARRRTDWLPHRRRSDRR